MIESINSVYVILIILLWNTSSFSFEWHKDFRVNSTVCDTDESYDFAKYLLRNINRKVNPCNDFYEYVCGAQSRRHSLLDFPTWSTIEEMTLKSLRRVQDILEDGRTVPDNPELNQAKKIHEACMKIPYLGVLNATMIRQYILSSNYFPTFTFASKINNQKSSWLDVHNYYMSLTADSGLFQMFTLGDVHNHYEPLLYLTEVPSPFGRILFTETLKSVQKRLYTKYLTTVLYTIFSSVFLKVSQNMLKERLQAVIAFRREIYAIKAIEPKAFTPNHNYNVMTVNELDNWNRIMSLEEGGVRIPWLEVVQAIYGKETSIETIKRMKINVINKSYHKEIVRLLKKTPKDVIVNHMHLYFIERHFEFNKHLENMALETILYAGRLSGTIMYLGRRWETCIVTNPMKEAIGKFYVKRYFSDSTREEISQLIEEFQGVLKTQIQDSAWLDVGTIEKMTQKVDSMNVDIGYPNYYKEETLRPRYTSIINPTKVEPSYCSEYNHLSISASVFQLPIYDSNLPKTVLYGTVGFFIAHELYHPFSPTSMKECHSFSLSRPKKLTYEDKTNCFVKKYNKMPVKELKHLSPTPMINGRKTLDENIADAMGLKLAYEAFRKHGWDTKECAVVPMLNNKLTCEQLFFVSFATIFCSVSTADQMLEEVLYESHSTPRVRVNGAVSNMIEFSRSFDCPKKAPMNPSHKCDIWK